MDLKRLSFASPTFFAAISIPCQDSSNLGECVSGIYSWSLAIVGIFAFAEILYAGWIYLTAAGNTTKTGEAMKKISNAVLGIVLLFSSYLILNTINPDLVGGSLGLPDLSDTKIEDVDYGNGNTTTTFFGGGTTTLGGRTTTTVRATGTTTTVVSTENCTGREVAGALMVWFTSHSLPSGGERIPLGSPLVGRDSGRCTQVVVYLDSVGPSLFPVQYDPVSRELFIDAIGSTTPSHPQYPNVGYVTGPDFPGGSSDFIFFTVE